MRGFIKAIRQRRPHVRSDAGATAVEYGLMVGLIAAVIIGVVTAFGLAVNGLFIIPAGVFS